MIGRLYLPVQSFLTVTFVLLSLFITKIRTIKAFSINSAYISRDHKSIAQFMYAIIDMKYGRIKLKNR
jgi:hypothetical protein